MTGELVAALGGLTSSAPVRNAAVAGLAVAVVSGMVGVITVVRGQSFAGHALTDMGTLGGAASVLAGVNPLWGFLGVGAAVGASMEAFGVERARGRDVSTGVALGGALAVAALLLHLVASGSTNSGATFTVLFGSPFSVSSSTVPVIVAFGLVGVLSTVFLRGPLLLSSVSGDLAAARGVPVRAVGLAFLVSLGIAMALSAEIVGTVLSTALLLGPAAIALRWTASPGRAMFLAAALGVAATWSGIVLAYESAYWPPAGHHWPVSFFVVALVFLGFVISGPFSGRAAGPPAALRAAHDHHGPDEADARLVAVRRGRR